MTDVALTVPSKRPFETYPNLAAALNELKRKANDEGLFDNLRWAALLMEIDCALATERNESYVRGMHDEHNEPLGDRLPPLHKIRT